MERIDIRLKEDEIQFLRSLIGNELKAIHHDEFNFVNSSSQVVGFETATSSFYLYSFTEPQDYYGTTEDVAIWSIEDTRYPLLNSKILVNTPINQRVCSIQLIQENQRLFKNGIQIYDVWVTRGIIIDFGDRQISFEKAVWFSEEIYIQKGYGLIEKFASTNNFVESDWDAGITAECSRSIDTI